MGGKENTGFKVDDAIDFVDWQRTVIGRRHEA